MRTLRNVLLVTLITNSSLAFSSNELGDLIFGAEVGYSSINDQCSISCDASSPSMGLLLGYQLSDLVAIEGTYLNEPSYKLDGNSVSSQTGLFGLRFSQPLGDEIYGFVSPGIYFTDMKIHNADLNSNSYSSGYIEAGLGTTLSKNLSIEGKYRYRARDDISGFGDSDNSSFSIALRYTFGNDIEDSRQLISENHSKGVHGNNSNVLYAYNNDPSEEKIVVEQFSFSESNVDGLFFDTGKSTVIDSDSFIKKISQFDPKSVKKVIVVGHTDNIGTSKDNLTLSKERAASVRDLLLKMNFLDSQIEIYGVGQDHPIASNASDSGRSENRRVDLTMYIYD
ncbi:hypothetical protein A1QO_06300 [Vibrio genomosp. F10 str. ZF-129]|uniref:OmpA-like domain-containing protein n=1 Tax=Vibrio genomosp. F10 str. ZF-129 TaxID=1187848 RepID=A0A1E5BH41_9VIBR|nr:OmpA family protein [Vibrio genomosp. F10]OEE34993.1 hypothetical protein A1QO_06300 [Vibrio genomosp. F10 str. ZF-129]